MQQQTIQKSFSISGVGLHSGQYITMEVLPAPVDQGIIFIRTDISEQSIVHANIRNLCHRMRCTALVENGAEVHTTEHFLASCLAMGLDNLTVRINGREVPGMDGSALPFFQALQEAGKLIQNKPANVLCIRQEMEVQEKKSKLLAKPFQNFVLEYLLCYDVPGFPQQEVKFTIDEETFVKEIAPARTFALKQEVDALLKLGLGKGANLQNTLVLDDRGQVIENHLRFSNEFARHKLLDLLGDLALLGCRIQGQIRGERSGHELNAMLGKKLLEEHAS